MFERKKINDVFPTWATGGGIFSLLQTMNVPWAEKDIALQLDLEYHGNVSGRKFVSPLTDSLIDSNNGEIDAVLREQIAGVVYALNELVWSKEWDTMFFEYDPISNYDSTEESTDTRSTTYGKTATQTNNLSHTKTGTETETPNVTNTRTDNTTQTDTRNLADSETNKIYGFNSSVGVNDSERSETHTGTDTVTNTGTVATATTGTDQTTYNTTDADTGTVQHVDGGTDSETFTHELTRKGNIGVTTSQQMIQSERELVMWNYFREIVFPSVDKILTLSIY